MSGVRALLSPQLLLLHVVAVLAVGLAGWLGWWQLSAWHDNRQDRALELADAEPRPLTDVLGPDDPFPGEHVGRPVVAAGEWVPDGSVYVGQRQRDSDSPDDGFWQVALLSVCGSAASDCAGASVVPVVLGWTADPDEGTAAPTGRTEVVGWLQPAEQSGDDPDPRDDVLPSLRTADLLQVTDRDVYSGYVILDSPARLRGDLVAVTPETLPEPPASTSLRNLLYGVEWWVFAGFALYLWWRWSRDAVAEARAEVQPEDPSDVASEDGSGDRSDHDEQPVASSP